jgi:hypothetical protein
MVKEISGSLSPVTGTRSFDLNFDSGSRGDREGEIQKSVRVKRGEDDSDISLSITFLENFHVRARSGEDDSDISLSTTQ